VKAASKNDTRQLLAEIRQVWKSALEPNESDLKLAAEQLRARDGVLVIEPASFFVKSWKQNDYVELWEGFIADHADRVLFLRDWEYSSGCVAEFCRANLEGVPTSSVEGAPIVAGDAVASIRNVLSKLEAMLHPPLSLFDALRTACVKIELSIPPTVIKIAGSPRKDQSLDQLAELINVAQFVSFEPRRARPQQAYSRVLGEAPNSRFKSVRAAADTLLMRSAEHSVNVRSFTPDSPLSREFIYGLTSVDAIVSTVERLTAQNLNTIINETVDIRDGGVSGVLLGNVIEFAPDDTPRAVEKPGISLL
jgi:hypothetical protein